MIFFLTKLVSQLVYPLAISLELCVLALGLLWFRRNRMAAAALGFAIVWLWFWSAPLTADRIRYSLEKRFPPVPIEHVPKADAIVVLGGGVDPISPPRLYPDLALGSDRMWHAARLYKAGKAPYLIVSGGFGFKPNEETGPESEAMAVFLKDLGVPESAILLESESRNTRENAQCTKKLLEQHGMKTILLVTSSMHMRRALALFKAAGIEVTPAATDYEIIDHPTQPLFIRLLPDARSLEGASRAFKEYLGALF